VSRGIADTSVFVATEAGRPLGALPDALAVSVITLAELELGVLRASDPAVRAQRLSTLSRVRGEIPSLPIDERIASVFAGLVAEMREAGLRPKIHDTWIAATAIQLRIPVCTQDDDFDEIPRLDVVKV
jgi:predicted nucleic acid-binding protein